VNSTVSRHVCITAALICLPGIGLAEAHGHNPVLNNVISAQRAALALQTEGAGYGPQSPRDIDAKEGVNLRQFSTAPDRGAMNLCNIHFHENAEHKGGEFTALAGNGDGHGYGTGFRYDGTLSDAELSAFDYPVGVSEHGDLVPGDTIEIHFVFSTAEVQPGPTLGACINEATANAQLRVETVVAVLVNDPEAASLTEIAAIAQIEGYFQVPSLPDTLGVPVTYLGSTTGPSYNRTASPYHVTWNVRPKVLKLHIGSVANWLADNPFDEDHAHGVRNLVINPELLSPIR
jgi:hypothetical protein